MSATFKVLIVVVALFVVAEACFPPPSSCGCAPPPPSCGCGGGGQVAAPSCGGGCGGGFGRKKREATSSRADRSARKTEA